MKTYSTQIRVEATHLDKGDHANWLVQLAIAQEVHLTFRDQLGLGLEYMKETHKLFLVMGTAQQSYRIQLRERDVFEVNMTMWVSSRTTLGFHCLFRKDERVATEMSWVMPLVSAETERLCKIPQWMIDIIGLEKPEINHCQPASSSN